MEIVWGLSRSQVFFGTALLAFDVWLIGLLLKHVFHRQISNRRMVGHTVLAVLYAFLFFIILARIESSGYDYAIIVTMFISHALVTMIIFGLRSQRVVNK